MRKSLKVVVSAIIVFIIFGATYTSLAATNEPKLIRPETSGMFLRYVNDTIPTGSGEINATLLSSSAEFAYTYSLTTNATTLKSGYVLGVQLTVSILHESISFPASGFSAHISHVSLYFGIQRYSNISQNLSGVSQLQYQNQILADWSQIDVFTFTDFGCVNNLYSSFNLSYQITPILLIGPYHINGNPSVINESLAVKY